MIRRLVPAALLLLLSIPLFAQDKPQPAEPAIQRALSSFIQAFDNLDWETFWSAFDDNATVFYPRGFPDRATGRDAFEEKFKVVFQQIRDGKTQAPFIDIQPKDSQIQQFGDMAIVTFHLDDRAGFLNRRTIVLHKTASGWKIVHLHASEVSTANGQR
jgi:ketosteroid isomerase-like protein